MKRGAFTMIELLVVIAIISILAALLFPVISQARVAAKQATCISQMRQIGMALRMYADDHDGQWAPSSTVEVDAAGARKQRTWIGYDNTNGPLLGGFYGRVDRPAVGPVVPGLIDVYLKNEAVKRCPSQPGEWQLAIALNWFQPVFPSAYYTRNPGARGNEYGPGTKEQFAMPTGEYYAVGAQDSEFEVPSETIVAFEHKARVPMCNFLQGDDWFNAPPDRQELRDHMHGLHRVGVVTIWADGHTRRMAYEQFRRPQFSVRKDIYPEL